MKNLSNQLEPISETMVDLRQSVNHPILLQYSEIFREVLVETPISHGRMNPCFKINTNAPFYIAAKASLKDETNPYETIFNRLSDYYASFQPKNIAEFYNFETNSKTLLSEPPWAGVLPWRARSLRGYKETIRKGTLSDNKYFGLKQGIEYGWAYCGPANEEKSRVEAKRLFDLTKSINQKGYIRNDGKDGDIIATALINDDFEWRWLVTNGYHRACVLAAIGYESIVVRINLVVRRGDVKFWPHVLDGLYSEREARIIFDNIFK